MCQTILIGIPSQFCVFSGGTVKISPSVVREQVVFRKGVTMNFLIRTSLYMALCLSFCMSASQLHGQVIYTITGFANNFPSGPIGEVLRAPEVGVNEMYIADFEIDLSVVDGNPSPDNGEYTGAILSSSIEFSGGYRSEVDFSGGDIVVSREGDTVGGGVAFLHPLRDSAPLDDLSGVGVIIVSDQNTPFASDALPTDLATEFDSSPENSTFVLFEPTGQVIGLSNVELDSVFQPMVFSVSIAPDFEQVLLGDVDRSGFVDFLDVSPFIALLSSGEFQAEADIDQSGEVDFLDISPFIGILAGSN